MSGNSIDWSSVGIRVEAEPDLRLLGDGDLRWSLYGRLGLFAGVTSIETDPATLEWDSTMAGVDLGIGTRVSFEHVVVGIGYLHRSHYSAESDVTASSVIREFDAAFSGFELSVGVQF